VDQAGARTGARARDVFRAGGVDRVRERLVAFGAVDIRVGRAIDHNIATFDELFGCGRIRDVPLRRRLCQHVAALTSRLCRKWLPSWPPAPVIKILPDMVRVWHAELGYPESGCDTSNLQ